MSQNQAAIALDGVTKQYGDFVAVDQLSLEVPGGVIYGVLGPNGAGKTTTLRMINDILAPDRGTIRLFGTLKPGRAAAARIGYLPEERGLYPKMRVGELLAFFAQLRGVVGREAATRAERWLSRLGLSEWLRHKVQDLSKGMQQKVQFAAALIHEPDLLVLDEPWSGLDPINADVLRDVVLEQRAAGKTILFSTHLMEQAEQIRRDAAGDRLVAVSFLAPEAESQARAGVLANGDLVAAVRERRGFLEVELAAGAQSEQLLKSLVEQGAGLRRFELVVPTLHQIFVDRVGESQARGQPT